MAADGSHDDKTQSFVALTSGTVVLHYKILEKIGSGGMGEVYLALDTKLNRKVALKFLPPYLWQDEDCRKRFMREAQAGASLDHPNIAAIHEVGEFQGRPFYAMQLVEGQSLKDVIAGEDLPIDRILEIGIQVCEGLQAAHDKGIIHRDIKPSNILLDQHGRVRIVDFGLASIRGSENITQTGSTIGTIGYMSPEQAQAKDIDFRSDLFSMGIVLYELISRHNPFKRDNDAATLKALIDDSQQPLARYHRGVVEPLETVIAKLLEKNPSQRYQSAAEVIRDLWKVKEDELSGPAVKQSQPSIAILPFVDLSANKDQEYFCDGISEEIINALVHVNGLNVVARTSAFAFKGSHTDIREIGRKLNVRTILEGSVRKEGKRVRITAQLVSMADGYHLWSEKYDRDVESIFAIQDEIGLAVADKLKSELLDEEKKAILKRHTNDPEAYNLYLKGIYFLRMYTGYGFERAIEHLKEALKKDPKFAPAYYGLAEISYVMTYFGNMAPNDAYSSAKAYAEKALQIDHTLAEAHAVLGLVHIYFEWDWRLAERELQLALELAPNSAMVHMNYSWFLSLTQRHDEAISEARQAQQLDPLSNIISTHVGLICIWGGQYESAIEILQNTLTMTPGFYLAHYYLGLAYRAKSMVEEAFAEFEKAVELNSDIAWTAMILAAAYFEFGRNTQGEKLFEHLKRMSRQMYVPPMGFFYIHLARGEMDQAAHWLDQACAKHDSFLPWCAIIPIDCYRIPDEPKFLEVLARAGFK